MLDLLITGGTYPDYEENDMKTGDVGIQNGSIVCVGQITEKAKEVIDARGKVVSPGFIDIHMHEENFAEEGERFVIAELMLRMGVTTCLGGNCGLQHQKIKAFRDCIERLGGSPVNYLMLVGYNSIRTTLGIGHRDEISKEVENQIHQGLRQELNAGAVGISFGLEYDPGMTDQEVLRAIESCGDEDLFISMHYRDDSTGASDAVKEMLQIADGCGKRFQISHLSSCCAMGQMQESLEVINEGIRRNPKIDYDTYPYHAFSTHIGSEVFSEGCFEKWKKDYDCLMLTDEPFKGKFCDQKLFELARKEYPDMLAVAFVMNEEEIAQAIKNPYGMIGSDGIIHNGNGHPRAAGTFPRVLGKYVREENCLTMVEALGKMTYAPAKRLKLKRKGQIRKGFDADITIFDPETVQDGATFEQTAVKPAGIEFVLIGGKMAIRNEEIVNDRLGLFLT